VTDSTTSARYEAVFREEIDSAGYDHADTTLMGIYADWLDDHGKNGFGYRLLVECSRAGALLSAWRVMARWEAGVSPLQLATCLADLDGVLAADGGEVRFICGPVAGQVVKDHPQVDKADNYPALSAALLPARYRTEEIERILEEGAFNTAALNGRSLYVYLTLDVLLNTLRRIALPVLV
jgi:hypothetical protein